MKANGIAAGIVASTVLFAPAGLAQEAPSSPDLRATLVGLGDEIKHLLTELGGVRTPDLQVTAGCAGCSSECLLGKCTICCMPGDVQPYCTCTLTGAPVCTCEPVTGGLQKA